MTLANDLLDNENHKNGLDLYPGSRCSTARQNVNSNFDLGLVSQLKV